MSSSGEKTILLIILIIIILFIFVRFVPHLFFLFRYPIEIDGNFFGPHRILQFVPPLLPILLLLIIGLIIVFWVYRDAERRGMNGVLWALLVFVGNFVGLIIYLIVRSEEFPKKAAIEPTQSCPGCGKVVVQKYAFCPHCGTRLKAVCPNCEQPVSSEWKVCPHCGQKLEKEK